MKLVFTVNGQSVATDCAPTDRLSMVLRDGLAMTGTKVGCDAGDCGACSVIVNGEICCACLVAAGQVHGAKVTTVEGLRANGALSRLQEAFLAHGAAQCGICTPGMLVGAAALLADFARPTRVQVEDALGGVLCRCTGYAKIIDAVLDASDGNRCNGDAAEIPTEVSVSGIGAGLAIGARLARLDGVAKVTGEDRFGADMVPADAVRVRLIRSPHAHARFQLGDTKRFIDDHPGLLAVLTAADVPGENRFGAIPEFADQPVFAEHVARFRGEAIAAVVGEPDAMRALDPDRFPVTWEPLLAVMTPSAARDEGAPRLHPERAGNILIHGRVARGDPEAGLAAAAHVVEGAYSTPFIEHAYIEPESGHARRVGDRIEVHGGTQAPHMDREALARIMGLAPADIRIVPTSCGGGFGAKIDISFQPYIALAAWRLGRSAAIVYSRAESMQSTTKRHPSEITIKVGCDAGGKLTAIDFHGIFNTGVYASWGPTVANRVPVHASGPYAVPHYRGASVAVHTNGPTAGAFRGFGVPQSAVALEDALSELADEVGMDQLEFRLLNALTDGAATVTGQVFSSGVGITACLDAVKPAWRRARREAVAANAAANGSGLRHGIGIASCWYGCGNTSIANPSTIRIGVTRKGRIVLHQGATDIGQGSNTVISQIAADALGLAVDALDLVGPDTDRTPDAGKTSASRQTYVSGSAALLAGRALRQSILRHANVGETARIIRGPDGLYLEDGDTVHAVDLSRLTEDEFGYVLRAEESYDPPTSPLDADGQGNPYAVYGYGVQVAELTVDTRLGTVKLDRITAAHDVGRAINPLLIEGQIEGGIAQGIGLALMEDYVPGRSENLHDYLIPTIGDMPRIDSLIVEVPDAVAPHGAKGLGEHVLIPTAPAILNAIRDATGAVVRHLPATPDKVLAAIREGEPSDV